MSRGSEYIKVARNSFMTRGAAILAGRISAIDDRDDLTVAIKIAPALVAARPVSESQPVVETPKSLGVEGVTANLTPAQVHQRIEDIRGLANPSLLSPEKQDALILGGDRTIEALRNYELLSGNAVLPTTKAKSAEQRLQDYAAASPALERLLTNCGRIKPPMSPDLKRIIGNTTPSRLSAADRQSLMLPRVVEIMHNYQQASGYKVLPVDREKELERVRRP